MRPARGVAARFCRTIPRRSRAPGFGTGSIGSRRPSRKLSGRRAGVRARGARGAVDGGVRRRRRRGWGQGVAARLGLTARFRKRRGRRVAVVGVGRRASDPLRRRHRADPRRAGPGVRRDALRRPREGRLRLSVATPRRFPRRDASLVVIRGSDENSGNLETSAVARASTIASAAAFRCWSAALPGSARRTRPGPRRRRRRPLRLRRGHARRLVVR